MKVKSLLFGTMIALAFTACSNNDDPISKDPQANTTGTTLEINANIVNTKAAGATYYAYVFNAAGTYETVGEVGTKIEVSEGTKTFVVINDGALSLTKNSSTIADVAKAITYSDSESTEATSTKNSCVYNANCQRGMINMVGYTSDEIAAVTNGKDGSTDANLVVLGSNSYTKNYRIPVYRNVANIVLTKVEAGTKTKYGATVYATPTISVDNVFILNAHNKALLTSSSVNAWWPTTEVAGSATESASYVNGVAADQFATWWSSAKDSSKRYIATGQTEPAVSTKLAVPYTTAGVASATTPWTPNTSFFVYENTSASTSDSYNPTLLVLHGSFSYVSNGKTITESNRYWTIQLGKTIDTITEASWQNLADFNLTLENANKLLGIHRNIQYSIQLTITGPGSDNPLYPGDDLKTYIQPAVQLVEWGHVTQPGRID